ncbi:MAG: hypothetical protein ACM3SV_11190 [Betaproteobacteria bacterium]|nr:hypothetical protein [Azonexus sp.]
MRQTNMLRLRLVGLGLVGLALLTFPLLSLPGGTVAGIPAAFLYLFGIWGLLIALAAALAERKAD